MDERNRLSLSRPRRAALTAPRDAGAASGDAARRTSQAQSQRGIFDGISSRAFCGKEDAMVPDASRWRSSSDYDYLGDLAGSDLAWECLRRNPDYQRDFAEVQDDARNAAHLARLMRLRWGIRFPDSTGAEGERCDRLLDGGGRSGDGAADAEAGAGPCCRRNRSAA
ncbi:transcriptional regulator domain-containing protein [Jiella pacifica]|uniref:Transcriptional regulator-like domain-containing protein n=1 Tax=Jiella pacifica TaxID=2696469 RepID=A0A6N9TAS6_9HYPH|nr:DUF6499 domain-containing protein [Jiella pacifica]NDW07662.1 hypothetical protein [Jiella pacifica]